MANTPKATNEPKHFVQKDTAPKATDLATHSFPSEEVRQVVVPTKAELRETFETLAASTYQGVPGVLRIDSGVEGPTLGITVMTHGNEPAGVAAVWAGLQEGGALSRLQKGSVIIAIGNLDAATDYFNEPEDASPAQLGSHRSIEVNMNRLPVDTATLETSSAEVLRARKLLPILAEFDAGVDIHSTDTESQPLLIEHQPIPNELLKRLPVRTIISNIGSAIQENALSSFFGGNKDICRFGVEAGQHESPEALANAIECTEALLSANGVIETEPESAYDRPKLYQRYTIVDSIFWEPGDENMMLTKQFNHLEPIHEGQILAEDSTTGKAYLSPVDGHIVFPFATGKPHNMNEEGAFIAEKVKKIVL